MGVPTALRWSGGVIGWSQSALLALMATALFASEAMAAVASHDSADSMGRAVQAAASDQAGGATTSTSARAPKKAVRYIWRINHGDTISDAFRAWARQSRNWQVAWEAPELVAQASVDVEGSFEDAVSKVIEALNRNDANLLARFYVDAGNGVLRVMERK